jgi:hypothetical protein
MRPGTIVMVTSSFVTIKNKYITVIIVVLNKLPPVLCAVGGRPNDFVKVGKKKRITLRWVTTR